MNKTAAVFGAIWGVFALVFSLFLFLAIFAPDTVASSNFAPFGNSVLLYYDGTSFSVEAWALAIGAFGLGALGLIGAGTVRHRHIMAGIFLLVSTVGMLVVSFQPFLVGEYSLLGDAAAFFGYGLLEQILAVLVTLLITLLGFLGSLFALAAKPKSAVQPPPAAVQPVAAAAPPPPPAQPTVSSAEPLPDVPEAQPATAQAETPPEDKPAE